MEKYSGKIVYRVRPQKEDFIDKHEELTYEFHFISFESDEDLSNFMKDDSRLEFIHLKNESVKSMLLMKGEVM